jgi:hypothetical protein
MTAFFRVIRKKFQAFNGVATRVFSTIIFSLVYILILPWFAVFAKKEKMRTTWYPWTLKSETLEDLKKQY